MDRPTSGHRPEPERSPATHLLDRLPEGARHPLVLGVVGVLAAGVVFVIGTRLGALGHRMGWTLVIVLLVVVLIGGVLIALGVRADAAAEAAEQTPGVPPAGREGDRPWRGS